MLEKEYWGLLTQQQFNQKLSEFTQKFGAPKKKVRLAIEVSDWARPEVDSRIKITNGHAEFVQKTGDWNKRERTELEIPLVKDAHAIFDLFKAIVISVNAQIPSQHIMQFENYIFDIENAEIKLAHQTGKSDKYHFEVELKEETKNLDQICKQLGLEPDHEPKDKAFWDKWNQELNLDATNMKDNEILELIQKYLLVS